ncbi:MAG: T9SS type A sorting domain-containing protein, partial [Bacteroidales bacterium]|nr:T9SS type A sorting domain-containing protein [Bacteroidales bacterium]
GTYGTIDSIIVSNAGNDIILTDTSGLFEFNIDDLPAGDYQFIVIATDDMNGQATDTIFFHVEESASSSSAYVLNTSGVIFYPNPVSNTLHFNKICDYEIFTILGRRILEGTVALQVDVSTLKAGLYLVKTNHGVSKLRKV